MVRNEVLNGSGRDLVYNMISHLLRGSEGSYEHPMWD
jgi:hypothetical protein